MPAPKKPDTLLLTLTEVSKKTGISMPTLQRYKKLYQRRIPTVGKGRTQRYKPEALAVFRALKVENLAKRGRPRKSATAPSKVTATTVAKRVPKKGAAKKTVASELLTLTEIGRRTSISYPTLLRYVANHAKQIPHKGKGRLRRFLPEAVEVFNELRAKSVRGRKPSTKKASPKTRTKSASPAKSTGDARLHSRLRKLETSTNKLLRAVERLETAIRKPVRLEVK